MGEKMVKARPLKNDVRRYVRGSLEAYCRGEQNLNWIKGVIEKSGALQHEGMLQGIFNELRSYENSPRCQEILRECQKEGWL